MQTSLQYLFRPRSVAIVGASDNRDKIGGRPVRMLMELGFDGEVYPVNPRGGTVQGLRCYESLLALPQAPDVVILAVPAEAIPAVIKDVVSSGARSVILLSSGFAETGMESDNLRQQQIASELKDHGIPLLGPNCLGVIDIRSAFTGTFSPVPLAGLPAAGPVAIVSQSGAVGAYLYILAVRAGLGLSLWVTTGNEAVIGTSDVVLALADDAQTQVIMLFIEGVRDGAHLRRALRAARRAGKHIVVCKVGRTEEGARAARSHTASLAGEDAVYDAVFEQNGALRVGSLYDMISYCKALSQPAIPQGQGVAIITVSGGVGTLMADAAIESGLALPPLPAESQDLLRSRVAFGAALNPIDVTAQINTDFELLDIALEEAIKSGLYSAMLLFIVAPASVPMIADALVSAFSRFRRRYPDMPLYLTGIFDPVSISRLTAVGAVVFEDPTEAVRVLSTLAKWRTVQIPEEGSVPVPAITDAPWQSAVLSEVEALAFFRAKGLASVPHAKVTGVEEAVAWWARSGEQVVLKVVSRDILHKSDVGGVRIGLHSEAAVRQAYAEISEQVAYAAPDARIDGMLVARMLEPRLELILGARWVASFGVVVVVGFGGTSVEWHRRAVTLDLPVSTDVIHRKLDELGVLQLLGAWRGRAPIAPQLLLTYITRFAEIAQGLENSLDSMEINPLMVTEAGVFAADGVLQWRDVSLTTNQGASLVLEDEVKRGGPSVEPRTPLMGGREASAVRPESLT